MSYWRKLGITECGISPREIGSWTPKELQLHVEGVRERQARSLWPFAHLTACFRAANSKSGKVETENLHKYLVAVSAIDYSEFFKRDKQEETTKEKDGYADRQRKLDAQLKPR